MELLTSLFEQYGLFGLCLMILLEYACFPISSEIVLPFCGAFASSYHISFFLLIPGSILAGLIGTSLCYFIGRIGGTRLLDGLKNRFPKTRKGIDASEEKMERYGALAVCFGRVIPLCRTYIAFIAGSVKQPYSQFLSYSLFGITVWNCILIGLGSLFKSNWNEVQRYYEEYKSLLIGTAVLLILVFILRKRFLKRRSPAGTSSS
ncbi:MAG: DedA family protein [Lachnospiraceae bacterium]|nr:DedA family protein [Lachnospiraceae bacterium]MBP3610951.1 DedA family protein [Lachnospiraceae bacterium]